MLCKDVLKKTAPFVLVFALGLFFGSFLNSLNPEGARRKEQNNLQLALKNEELSIKNEELSKLREELLKLKNDKQSLLEFIVQREFRMLYKTSEADLLRRKLGLENEIRVLESEIERLREEIKRKKLIHPLQGSKVIPAT